MDMKVEGNVLTDFYNLNGKHVKHIEDGKIGKKIVLISSKNQKKVDQAINEGKVVDVVSDKVVDEMENAYNNSEKTGNEFGFVVGDNGKASKLVEGKSGEIGTSEWNEAKQDLATKSTDDSTPAYDVHVHPLHKDKYGEVVSYGLPIPSDTDVKPENNRGYTKPSIILGYTQEKEFTSHSTLGGTPKMEYKRSIGFYTTKGSIMDEDEEISF